MPAYNGNNAYIRVDGFVDVSPFFASINMQRNVGDEDVTGGANARWEEHADKLERINIDVTLTYDAHLLQDYLPTVARPGVHRWEIGTEGQQAGKPKHDQHFKLNSIRGPVMNHDKTKVQFEIQAVSSGEPFANFYDGATW
jgi:hypothetical protein